MDLQAVMGEQHLTWQDPAIGNTYQSIQQEFSAAQRALLGDERFKTFEAYERTTWQREMMVGWAGGAAVVLREPFTAEQGEQLVQIMANASANFRHGGDVNTSEPGYWDAVAAEAKKILTPTQYAYFTTTEPPLPVGARFQTQFYDQVHAAVEAEKKATAPPRPVGGP